MRRTLAGVCRDYQSFGTALVAIAFSVYPQHGPTLALALGTVCASLGVVVNVVRRRAEA